MCGTSTLHKLAAYFPIPHCHVICWPREFMCSLRESENRAWYGGRGCHKLHAIQWRRSIEIGTLWYNILWSGNQNSIPKLSSAHMVTVTDNRKRPEEKTSLARQIHVSQTYYKSERAAAHELATSAKYQVGTTNFAVYSLRYTSAHFRHCTSVLRYQAKSNIKPGTNDVQSYNGNITPWRCKPRAE